MLKWLGDMLPKLFDRFGWGPALIVIVVLFALLVGAAWLFGFNLSMLGL